jgi:hypothetical protein
VAAGRLAEGVEEGVERFNDGLNVVRLTLNR